VWHGGTRIEAINTSLKFAYVLPAGTALEATWTSVVRIVPTRKPVEFELDECDQWRLPEHEVYFATLDKLLDLGIGLGKETAEIVTQHRFIPPTQRHQVDF
jgi:hypothetical protein